MRPLANFQHSKNNVNMLDVSTNVKEGGIANIWIICKVQSINLTQIFAKCMLLFCTDICKVQSVF